MRQIGRALLVALAGFVAAAAAVRPLRPVARPVAGPAPGPPAVAAVPPVAEPVVEDGSSPALAVGFVKQLTTAVREHRLTMLSAGLAYYGFFTMFPLTIAAVSIYGLLGDPADLEDMVDRLASVFPEPTAEFLTTQLDTLFAASPSGLGVATGVSLLATLWSASASTRALMVGINAVHEQSTAGRALMVRVWALVSTLALILVSIALVAVAAFLPRILDALGVEEQSAALIALIRWPVLLLLIGVALTLLYRSTPGSTFRRDGWFSIGAWLATAAIVLATLGLSWVVGLGNYADVYGALTGLAVLMLWFFVSGLMVLVGAEFDRLLNERRRASRPMARLTRPAPADR